MKIFSHIKSFIKNDNPEAQIKWSLYLRVWREFGKPYWKLMAAGAICTVLAASAEAFSITLVKKVIDQGFIEKNMDILYAIGLQVIGVYIVKGGLTYGKVVFMAKAGLRGASRLRRRLFAHMVRLHVGYFNEQQTGPLMNSFTGLSTAVMSLVTERVISIVQNIATVVMMFGLMLWYAPQLTAIILVLLPCIVVPLTIIMRKRRILSRRSFSVEGGSLSHIAQGIFGIKTIQAFVTEDTETKRMDQIEDKRVDVALKSAKLSGLQSPLLEVMISFGLCGALILGGHFITSGSITTGDFTAFILALTASYKPAKTLTNIGGGIQNGLIAAEILFKQLDQKSEIKEAPDAIELVPGEMDVALENVSFAYARANGNVLNNVSLMVPRGKVCAFVGASGGGKTTIFNLLLRFYDVQQGRIVIGGRDIREYSLASLRHNIASVSQEVFMFNGSVAENIRYGSPNASLEEVVAAAQAANAHDFIRSFPQKYNQPVGERGALLSGGQKQRIAIARAILKNAPILLLDEATSALDSESEKLIQEALKRLMRGRTTFVIAHRLATILTADMICVVQRGRIIEKGTDSELSALGGTYKKLKDIQFRQQPGNGNG